MATITESAPVTADRVERIRFPFLVRLRELLRIPEEAEDEADLTLIGRVRKFLWLWSGLFSAASFAIPTVGYVAFGTVEGAGTSFLAAIVSAGLFGLACLLHFGPESA